MVAGDLAKYIREVIVALQKIGLKVVATVCDQLAANSIAIRILMDDTKFPGI